MTVELFSEEFVKIIISLFVPYSIVMFQLLNSKRKEQSKKEDEIVENLININFKIETFDSFKQEQREINKEIKKQLFSNKEDIMLLKQQMGKKKDGTN